MNRENAELRKVWRAWRAGVLGTAVVLFGSSLVIPTAASALGLEREGGSDKRITIELIDTPLRVSLAKISELFGTPIDVSGLSGDERRVSLSLQDATLQESLDRILASVDYVTIHTSQGSLAILVIERNSDAEMELSSGPRDGPSDLSPDQFSTVDDLFPPPELVKSLREKPVLKSNSAEPRELDLNDPNLFSSDWSETIETTPAEVGAPGTDRNIQMSDTSDQLPSGEELRLLLGDLNPTQPRETALTLEQFGALPSETSPTGSNEHSEPRRPENEYSFLDSLPPPDFLKSLVNNP